ncbi:MAG: dienelactone hydrolase, partial [Verrucomicrobiales bacterium]
MKTLLVSILLGLSAIALHAQDAPPLKDLNGFFPFEVPETLEAWEERAADLRQRVLVANGLWPMPEKTPLNPVIHGKFERPGFTVEKVYFESYPGLFVTGLLFRPENPPEGKLPAVLSPHGHGGRLQDHGVEGVLKQIEGGGEKFKESGRMPKVARCATLARLGCVVFLYDMFGYADSNQLSRGLAHGFKKQRPDFEGKDSWGLFSAQAEMRMQSIFGLQTWNSIRGLDFLESLPDVDPKRIAVTGGSGGGTQTIMLCAIDSRPIAGFPNGMVSSAMQGGCTCENASLLRIGTGNVELAALFAPKPQGMTAANDWTKEMLVPGKGFPELQKLYGMYGKVDNVICEDLLHFGHNYNYVSRAVMYSWFNKHLDLGLEEPIVEEDFKLLTAEEHAVWTVEHPEPEGGDEFERNLTNWIADQDQQLLDAMTEGERRETVRAAWRTMIGASDLSGAVASSFSAVGSPEKTTLQTDPKSPSFSVFTAKPKGDFKFTVVWTHEKGKDGLFKGDGTPTPAVQGILDRGGRVITANLHLQGDEINETPVVANPRESASYTHAYNDSVFAERVQNIL